MANLERKWISNVVRVVVLAGLLAACGDDVEQMNAEIERQTCQPSPFQSSEGITASATRIAGANCTPTK